MIYFSDFDAVAAGNPYGYVANGALVSWVSTGGSNIASGPTNVAYPAGILANDILTLSVELLANSGTPGTLDTPTDWTLVSQTVMVFSGYQHYVFWKRATGSESGTLGLTGGAVVSTSGVHAVMSAWGGCVATGSPITSLVNNTGQSANAASAAVTTSADNQIVCNYVATDDDTSTMTPPADYIEAYDLHSTTGVDGSLGMNHKVAGTAGVQGSVTTVLATSERWNVVSFGLVAA